MTVKNQHNKEAGQQRLGINPRIVTLINDAGSRKEKDLTGLQKNKSEKGQGFNLRCDGGATSQYTMCPQVKKKTDTGDCVHITNTLRLRVHASREPVCRNRFRESRLS